jgi:hypothetical protein
MADGRPRQTPCRYPEDESWCPDIKDADALLQPVVLRYLMNGAIGPSSIDASYTKHARSQGQIAINHFGRSASRA